MNVIPENIRNDRTSVLLKHNPGEFWKPCPGTTGEYLCCGYQILTPVTGCGMLCDYCILQVYFPYRCQVVFSNFSDLEREVKQKIPRWGNRVIRFGTGEFGDSLFLDESYNLSGRIARLLDPYENVLLELKTKSVGINRLRALRHPEKVIIGFSLSTKRNIALFEQDTAPLAERLRAIRECEKMGFWVAVHWDPMIRYEGWESDYRRLVDQVFEAVDDPEKIAWWSLGGFRAPASLKSYLSARNRHLPLFSDELIRGSDGKFRYFRPLRTAFYRLVHEKIETIAPDTTLYLCMESREVWRDAGMEKRIPGGLVKYLDNRADRMLGRR